jgi:alpha-glucosidase (family GH31 glycosyl hydrolase)
VIVVDYSHWTWQGDWRFDPAEWPDPAGMVAELERLGLKLMVSVWPTVNPAVENYAEMAERGLLVASERGIGVHLPIWDKGSAGQAPVSFYHATNPQARGYIWAKTKEGYYKQGIRAERDDLSAHMQSQAFPPTSKYSALYVRVDLCRNAVCDAGFRGWPVTEPGGSV